MYLNFIIFDLIYLFILIYCFRKISPTLNIETPEEILSKEIIEPLSDINCTDEEKHDANIFDNARHVMTEENKLNIVNFCVYNYIFYI